MYCLPTIWPRSKYSFESIISFISVKQMFVLQSNVYYKFKKSRIWILVRKTANLKFITEDHTAYVSLLFHYYWIGITISIAYPIVLTPQSNHASDGPSGKIYDRLLPNRQIACFFTLRRRDEFRADKQKCNPNNTTLQDAYKSENWNCKLISPTRTPESSTIALSWC